MLTPSTARLATMLASATVLLAMATCADASSRGRSEGSTASSPVAGLPKPATTREQPNDPPDDPEHRWLCHLVPEVCTLTLR